MYANAFPYGVYSSILSAIEFDLEKNESLATCLFIEQSCLVACYLPLSCFVSYHFFFFIKVFYATHTILFMFTCCWHMAFVVVSFQLKQLQAKSSPYYFPIGLVFFDKLLFSLLHLVFGLMPLLSWNLQLDSFLQLSYMKSSTPNVSVSEQPKPNINERDNFLNCWNHH